MAVEVRAATTLLRIHGGGKTTIVGAESGIASLIIRLTTPLIT